MVDAFLPPIKYASFLKAHQDVLAASVTSTVNGKVRHDKNSGWEKKLELAMLDAYHIGEKLLVEDYALAINRFRAIARQLELYMEEYDYILTPTLTQLPAKLGTLSMEEDFRTFRNKVGQYTTFLAIINACGQLAASLLLYWSEENVPVGVQLIGRFAKDADLLRVCAQIEQAAPWIDRWPAA